MDIRDMALIETVFGAFVGGATGFLCKAEHAMHTAMEAAGHTDCQHWYEHPFIVIALACITIIYIGTLACCIIEMRYLGGLKIWLTIHSDYPSPLKSSPAKNFDKGEAKGHRKKDRNA